MKIAALLAACVLVSCATCPPRVVVALDSLGRPTPDWIDAIRERVTAEQLATIAQTSKPLSTDEPPGAPHQRSGRRLVRVGSAPQRPVPACHSAAQACPPD